MYLEAQAHMRLYINLTAATEIGIYKTKLNKDHHSFPDFSLLDSPVLFLPGFKQFSTEHFDMLLCHILEQHSYYCSCRIHPSLNKNIQRTIQEHSEVLRVQL